MAAPKSLQERLKEARRLQESARLTMLVKDDRLKAIDLEIRRLKDLKARIEHDCEVAPALLEKGKKEEQEVQRLIDSYAPGMMSVGKSDVKTPRRQKLGRHHGESRLQQFMRLKAELEALEKELGT